MRIVLLVLSLSLFGVNVKAGEAYHSISIRSSKTGIKDDYELKVGVADVMFLNELHLKYERENDFHYRGLHAKTNKYYKLYGEVFIDEAKNINEQWLYRDIMRVLDISIRVSSHWQKWQNPALMGGLQNEFQFTLFGIPVFWDSAIDTDFNSKTILRNRIVLKLLQGQSLNFYRHSGSGADYWQIKQIGEYRF